MNPIYFIIGVLAVLIAFLFFGFIAVIWALRQLVIIGDQNDAIISFLQQITVNNWDKPYIRARLQEDKGNGSFAGARETELVEAYRPSETSFAQSR
jgi:hypothetical protein